jgi:short-subunit dehydrogenase
MREALVTGASSGIGAMFARKLAQRGRDLILVARRRERLEALARELEGKHGIRVEPLAADLARDDDLARVEERIRAAEALELLVNNAGFGTRGWFHEADLEPHERMHRLHVLATVRLTHAALLGMTARGRGGIVNVSSVAGFVQTPGNTSYAATKAWMISFTEGLHLELKAAGSPVKVQALCPGFTYSEFHDVAGMDRQRIPKAWWMQAEEVVEASLRGLERGKLIVVPGWRYRLVVFVLGLLPRALLHAGSIQYAARYRGQRVN